MTITVSGRPVARIGPTSLRWTGQRPSADRDLANACAAAFAVDLERCSAALEEPFVIVARVRVGESALAECARCTTRRCRQCGAAAWRRDRDQRRVAGRSSTAACSCADGDERAARSRVWARRVQRRPDCRSRLAIARERGRSTAAGQQSGRSAATAADRLARCGDGNVHAAPCSPATSPDCQSHQRPALTRETRLRGPHARDRVRAVTRTLIAELPGKVGERVDGPRLGAGDARPEARAVRDRARRNGPGPGGASQGGAAERAQRARSRR